MTNSKIPTVELHPATKMAFKKGHPWVTADRYSLKFPSERLLKAPLDNTKTAIILHDPLHQTVKGRLWKIIDSDSEYSDFNRDLESRIRESFLKRLGAEYIKERENYYLIFGEADELPGLHLLKLGPVLYLQYYDLSYAREEHILLSILSKVIQELLPDFKTGKLYIQERGREDCKMRPVKLHCFTEEFGDEEFTLREFDLCYKIFMNKRSDVGIYTDMSSVRKALTPIIKKSKRVLNLYSYTGAYSLYALSFGAEVTSIDLSRKYIEILEKNIEGNANLEMGHHHSMTMSVRDGLKELNSSEKRFDMIICDPPSFSSNGKSSSPIIKEYPELIASMMTLLDEGGHLVLFLNTHTINFQKFKEMVSRECGNKMRIIRNLKLAEDCPTLKGFPEGDYLKGLHLIKIATEESDR